MPRPLIVKIEDSMNHLYEPSKNMSLSKEFSKSLPKIGGDSVIKDMVQTNSLVRNLISMYEDPNLSKSNLMKSKSMSYIAPSKPLAIVAPKIDINDKETTKNNSRSNREKFDFQSVWRKFESSTTSEVEKTKVVKKTQREVTDFGNVRNKAQSLLDDYGGVLDSVWKAQVLAFLKNICSIADNVTLNTSESHTQNAAIRKEVQNTEYQHTVKEKANLWERQNSGTPKTDKLFERYFTGVATNNDDDHDDDNNNYDNNNDDTGSSASSFTDSEHSQVGYNLHESASPKMKIFELKSYFESKKDTTTEKTEVVENTEEVVRSDSEEEEEDEEKEKPKEPREVVRNLIQQIQHYKKEIESISVDDIDQGSQINEELIQILIQLDDVFCKDEEVLAERKEAIKFVQACIRMLREKMRS